MSTFSEVRNAIQIRFRTEFSSVQTCLDNQNFTPPEPAAGVKWARLNVQFNSGTQDSFGGVGNRKFLKAGTLIMQIFTPIDSATDTNDTFCQDALDLFDGVRLDDVWFINGGVTFSGSDGDWFQQNVSFDIIFEDIK